MHFSVGDPFFCRKTHFSAVRSGGLRIMNCSLFLDEIFCAEELEKVWLQSLASDYDVFVVMFNEILMRSMPLN